MKALFWRKAGMQYRRAYSYEFSLWLSKTCQANIIISIKGESVCDGENEAGSIYRLL